MTQTHNIADKAGEYKDFSGVINWRGTSGIVKNALFILEENCVNTIDFKDGEWLFGCFNSGIWRDGVWKNGTFVTSVWCFGKWVEGLWMDGLWVDGVWYDGIWHSGEWMSGFDCDNNRHTTAPAEW